MRGSPSLQLALLLVGFMLLGLPLVRLTGKRLPNQQPTASQPTASNTERTTAQLRVSWAHRPQSLALELEGKPLVPAIDLASSPFEATVDLALPADGFEINAHAEWPAGTPYTALTIELEPDGHDAQAPTRWTSSAKLEAIFPFLWK